MTMILPSDRGTSQRLWLPLTIRWMTFAAWTRLYSVVLIDRTLSRFVKFASSNSPPCCGICVDRQASSFC